MPSSVQRTCCMCMSVHAIAYTYSKRVILEDICEEKSTGTKGNKTEEEFREKQGVIKPQNTIRTITVKNRTLRE